MRFRYGASSEIRQVLKRILLAMWPGETTAHDLAIEEALDRLFAFCNGDVFLSRLIHYCNGCHPSRQHAVDELVEILFQLLIDSGIPIFMVSRWLKLGPGLKWFARALVPFNILVGALDRFLLIEEEQKKNNLAKGKGGDEAKGNGKGADQNVNLDAAAEQQEFDEIGQRLKKARVKFAEPTFRFIILVTLYHVNLCESLARVLFHVSSITLRIDPRGDASSVRGRDPCP